jgi:Flp pilus assembly protein TadD
MNILMRQSESHAETRAQRLRKVGLHHYRRGDSERAEVAIRRALEAKPGFIKAKIDLGVILRQQRRHAEAESILRSALEAEPRAEYAHNALGLVLRDTKRLKEAEIHFRKAIEIRPDFYEAQNNLGLVLGAVNHLEEAESAFRRALSINAASYQAWSNLGNVLLGLGKITESIRAHRHALTLKPGYAAAKVNLAPSLLAMGEYEEGWALYESRYDATLGTHFAAVPPVQWPMWRGEPLAGKSLLVWPEQGFGDILQFCRYTSMLKAHGVETLSLACPPTLERLFKSLEGVDFVYPMNGEGSIPRHDYWCLVMSLPHRFGTTLDTVPASTPYLRPPRDLVSIWRERLPKARFRVGLVWAGDPRLHSPGANAMDSRRSTSLEAFLPILRVSGVTFVSLQLGAIAREQIGTIAPEARPFDPMDGVEDFADTAAIIESLDLVISVDTSVVHVAGALDKPVWILSRYDTCWRWLRERSDSPWYPSARLFRQKAPGDWTEPMRQAAQALQDIVNTGAQRQRNAHSGD